MTTQRDLRTAPNVVVEHDIAVRHPDSDRESRLRWAPIMGGLLASLGLLLLLGLLAIAVGLGATTPDGGRPTTIAIIAAAVVTLLSFFAGGYIASWSAVATDEMRGALYGFLVWASWLLLLLIAGSLGLGQLFGAAGGMLDDLRAPDLTRQQVIDTLGSGAWPSFLALGLSAAAASLGGAVGAAAGRRRR